MMLKIVAGTASAALCLTQIAPALAQDYQHSGFDGPRGANATLNLRLPLGRRAEPARPTLGLTVGFGQTFGAPTSDGRRAVRQMRLADVRLDRTGVSRARLASFDLADLDRGRRLNLNGEPKKSFWLLIAAALGAGAALLLLLDSDSEDSSDSLPDLNSLG